MPEKTFFNQNCKIYPLKKDGNCKCYTLSQPCKVCSKNQKFSVFLRPLSLAFECTGLNLTPKEKESNVVKSVFKRILACAYFIFIHLFIIYRVLALTFRVYSAGYTVKLAALLIFRELLVIIMWYTVYRKRKNISKLVLKFEQFWALFTTQNGKNLHLILRVLLACMYVIPVFLSVAMTAIMTHEEAQAYENIALLGHATTNAAYYVNFLLYCFYNFYLLLLPFLVAMLYVFKGIFLSRMLQFCCINLKKSRSLDIQVGKLFELTTHIFSIIDKMEDSLSVCIFLVVTLNLTNCFTSFAYVLGYYSISPSATVGVVVLFICSSSCFIIIVWVASDVNNGSKDAKKAFLLALSRVERGENQTPSNTLMRLLQFDVTVLTGWQMFDFSRSLILAASGTILTYGLLILQTRLSSTHAELTSKHEHA